MFNLAPNSRLNVYLELMRVDKPIGVLLLLWPTWWGLWMAAEGIPRLDLFVIFTLGTFLMRSAGCVINDYADRNFDAHVTRTAQRPFARQAVSEKEALYLAAGLALCAFLLVLPLSLNTLLLSIPALFIAASYPFTKRFFAFPQAYLGLAFSCGIPMAFMATQNQIPLTAYLLMLANFFWTIAYDTAYALTDKPDDLKIGIRTSAISLGQYDVLGIMICHALFLLIMFYIGLYTKMGWFFYTALILVAIHQIRQYFQIRHRDRLACFASFLSNNQIGYLIFLGILFNFF